VSNYIVMLERQGQPPQRLAIVAPSRESAISSAIELAGADNKARASVVLEGEW